MSAGEIKIVLTMDGSNLTINTVKAGQELKTFQGTVERTGESVDRIEKRMNSLGTSFRHAVQFFGAARFALLDFYNVFLQLPQHILKTSGELERLTKLMEGLSTATTEAARKAEALSNTKFIIQSSLNAPFDVKALSDSFVKFKAAGLDPLNGSFRGLVDSVAKFGGTSETMHRASVAIQQMAGKGVISMEELRQQLGEAVPTAMRMMADSMGMSMADLVKHISKGEVLAGPALERLFLVMQARNSGAAQAMMNTWTGAVNQLKTNFSLWEQEVASAGFMDSAKDAVKAINDALGSDAGRAGARELGRSLGSIVSGTVDIVRRLYEMRDALQIVGIAIASVWGAQKIASMFGGMNAALAGWKANVAASNAIANAEYLKHMSTVRTANAAIAVSHQELATLERIIITQKMAQRGAASSAIVAGLTAETAAIQRNIAALTSEAAVAQRAAQAKTGVGLAISRLLGPLSILATALSIGATLWELWGNSASKALAKARQDANDGNGTQETYSILTGRIDSVNAQLKKDKAELDALDQIKSNSPSSNSEGRARALRDRINKQTSDIAALLIERKAAVNGIMRSSYNQGLQDLQKSNDERLGEISSAGDREKAKITDTAEAAIKVAGKNTALINKINTDAAKARAAEDAKVVQRQRELIDTNYSQAKANYERVQALGSNASAAELAKSKATFDGLAKLRNDYVEKSTAANKLLGNSIGGLGSSKNDGSGNNTLPHNGVADALAAARGELTEIELRFDALKVGAQSTISKREEVEARIAKMISSGKLYNSTGGKDNKRITPDINSREIQELIEKISKTEDYEEALKVLTRVRQLDEQSQETYDEAMERADLSINKVDASITAITRTFARLRANVTDNTLALTDFDKIQQTIKERTINQKAVEFTKSLTEQNEQLRISNILFEGDQKEQRYQAEIRKSAREVDGLVLSLQRLRTEGNGEATDKRIAEVKQAAYDRQLQMAEQHRLDMRTPLEKMVDDWKDGTKVMNDATAKWANDSIEMMVTMAETGKLNFSSLVTSILKDVYRMTIRASVGENLQTWFSQGGGILKDMIFGTKQTAQTSMLDEDGNEIPVNNNSASAATIAATSVIKKFSGSVSDATGGLGSYIAKIFSVDTATATTSGSLSSVAQAAQFAAMALNKIASMGGFGGLGKFKGFGGSGESEESLFGQADGSSDAIFMGEEFANGGIMTKFGKLGLKSYANGGIANSPQLALFGEGRMNEAYVPLPDGRSIPVSMKGGGDAPNVQVNIINQTGTKVTSEQSSPRFDGRQMILDVVLSAAASPGPFRDSMRGAIK